jgi:sugar phosphate isomerase/epimerase
MKEHTIARRDFDRRILANSASLWLSAMAIEGCFPILKEKLPHIALQLYTVRDLAGNDFPGTLEKVAKIGYKAVEFAGFWGQSAKEVRKLLDDLDLKCISSHADFEQLQNRLAETLDFHQQIGCPFIVCSTIPVAWRQNGAEGFKRFGTRLSEIGAQIKKSGMQLCYHNHDFEFKIEEEKFLIDHFLDSADPDLVKAEVDVYWIQYGGADPIDFLRDHSGRCPLLHIKDMTAGEKRAFAPVGTGILNMPGIMRAAPKAGAVWYIVEQDQADGDMLQAITVSLKKIKALLK